MRMRAWSGDQCVPDAFGSAPSIQQQIGDVEIRIHDRDHQHAVAICAELGAGRILLADVAIREFRSGSMRAFTSAPAASRVCTESMSPLRTAKNSAVFWSCAFASDFGPSREERFDSFGMSFRGRPHQRRLSAITFREVHIRARGQK